MNEFQIIGSGILMLIGTGTIAYLSLKLILKINSILNGMKMK